MSKYINLCNIYTVAWMLYYLQGTLYENGSEISQGILLFLLLAGVFFVYKVNALSERTLFFKGLNAFLLLLTVYGTLQIAGSTTHTIREQTGNIVVSSSSFLKNVLISLLPMYAYYYFSLKGQISKKWIKACLFFLLAVTTVQYFYYYKEMLLKALYDNEEFTNNVGYVFLSLMPFLLLFKKQPLLQLLLLCYISSFILFSMKRGAIFIAVICLLYFFYTAVKASNGFRRYLLVALFVAFVVGIGYEINEMYLQSDYFIERIERTQTGDTSNRGQIYLLLWEHFFANEDWLVFLLGEGANTTIEVAGDYAHQDWLELLINCGFIGAVTYLVFFVCFYWNIRQVPDMTLRMILYMSFIILLVRSMFSMGYESIGLEQGMLMAYCFAMGKRQEKGIKADGVSLIRRKKNERVEKIKNVYSRETVDSW